MRLRYEEYMPCIYTTSKDLMDRLSGTICRYDGVPKTVEYHSPVRLDLYALTLDVPAITIKPSDPKFDISSIEVGYMNWLRMPGRIDVVYLLRNGKKQYRQGITAGALDFFTIEGDQAGRLNVLNTKAFEDSVMNRFPTVDEALGSMKTVGMAALSQEVAIRKERSGIVLVYHRTKNVGYMLPDSDEVTLARGQFQDVVAEILSPVGLKIRI